MLVKFLREEKVLDGSGKIRQHFREGETVDLPTASARHWLNREAAERVKASVPQYPSKAEVKPTTEKLDSFAPFQSMPDPKEEPVKRRPGRPRKAESGPSPESGSETPSPSAPEGQASPESKSTTSEAGAGSSSSTTPTNSLHGLTYSTHATPVGGESTGTLPASKG